MCHYFSIICLPKTLASLGWGDRMTFPDNLMFKLLKVLSPFMVKKLTVFHNNLENHVVSSL